MKAINIVASKAALHLTTSPLVMMTVPKRVSTGNLGNSVDFDAAGVLCDGCLLGLASLTRCLQAHNAT